MNECLSESTARAENRSVQSAGEPEDTAETGSLSALGPSAILPDHVRSGSLAAAVRGLANNNTIEQMVAGMPYDCHFNTGSGFAFRRPNPDGTLTYTHAYCHMLTCRTCARRRCLTAVDAIRAAVTAYNMHTHVTLTLPPGCRCCDQGPRLSRANGLLLRSMRDRIRRPFSYVWAFGCANGGCLHLHMLTDAVRSKGHGPRWGVSAKWVKSKWRRLTGSRHARVNGYQHSDALSLSRYLVKNVLETVVAGHRLGRRCGCSRDISLFGSPGSAAGTDSDSGSAADPGPGWERVRGPSSYHGRRLGVCGVGRDINPTFIAPALADPPPCRGTGEDGTAAQGGGGETGAEGNAEEETPAPSQARQAIPEAEEGGHE